MMTSKCSWTPSGSRTSRHRATGTQSFHRRSSMHGVSPSRRSFSTSWRTMLFAIRSMRSFAESACRSGVPRLRGDRTGFVAFTACGPGVSFRCSTTRPPCFTRSRSRGFVRCRSLRTWRCFGPRWFFVTGRCRIAGPLFDTDAANAPHAGTACSVTAPRNVRNAGPRGRVAHVDRVREIGAVYRASLRNIIETIGSARAFPRSDVY